MNLKTSPSSRHLPTCISVNTFLALAQQCQVPHCIALWFVLHSAIDASRGSQRSVHEPQDLTVIQGLASLCLGRSPS